MKKKWICIIGATVLAPICSAVLVGVISFIGFCIVGISSIVGSYIDQMDTFFPVFHMVFMGGLFLIASVFIWIPLYQHCKKHKSKKLKKNIG